MWQDCDLEKLPRDLIVKRPISNTSFAITRSALLTLALVLSACSNLKTATPVSVVPTSPASLAAPVPTIEYRCAGGKRFHVRYREDGTQAWVLLADREVILNRIESQLSTRYVNGAVILDAKGLDATLATGTAWAYTECKMVKT